MNILITYESLVPSRGGPYYTINSLAGALVNLGHRVTVVYLDYGKEKNYLLKEGVSEVAIPGFHWRLLGQNFAFGLKRKFLQVIKEREIDVVIDNGIWLYSNHAVLSAATEANVPVVLAPRGLLEEAALDYKSWKKKIAWIAYQKRDLIKVKMFHACSEKEATSIKRCGFSQAIVIVPNAVDLPTDTTLLSEPSKDGKRHALFLSRVHETKGVVELVEAWIRLNPNDWVLDIAGGGSKSYINRINDLIDSSGMTGRIRLLGPIHSEAKHQLFRDAELFVLPTYTENFGVVIAEALSYGLPVITTTGAPWAVIEEMQLGWWIELSNENLDDALRSATVCDAPILREMGSRGRDLAKARFSWPTSAKSLARSLQTLVEHGE